MDRRPYVIAFVISVSALAVAAGAMVSARKQVAAAEQSAGKGETASCGMALGEAAASHLPKGTILLPAAQTVEFKGYATCGHCEFQIGESCNTMLWDRDGHHITAVLPNDRLTELQKVTGTCATGDVMVIAKGVLTEYRGMNYLLLTSFEAKS